MKILSRLFILAAFLLIPAWPAWALEFENVDFIDGTLLTDGAKLVSDPKEPERRFYISSGRQVEFTDKQSGVTLQLFESANNPVLIYRITVRKNAGVFYAVLDREVSHAMKTSQFKLIGAVGQGGFTEYLNLDILKEQGWQAEGLQLRIEEKQLYVEGVTKDKNDPDYLRQPFLLEWDDKGGAFVLTDLQARRAAEDLPKALREGDFNLAGLALGDNISAVTAKYGQKYDNSELEDENSKKTWVRWIYDRVLAVDHDKADGSIWQIQAASPDFPTARGLKVGMGYKEMLEQYGHNFYKKREAGAIHFIYSFKRQHLGADNPARLGFMINERNKIVRIYVDQLSKVGL